MREKMKKKIIDIIVGARPNFMKAAALFALAKDFPTLKLRLVHTGQHYDSLMSEVFVQDLSLPAPVCCLEVGSGSHASQTAGIMKKYEQWVQSHRPDICMVVGDVNSTVACAIVAAKLGIKVAHVEAGLRSFDRTMPEEINRVLTDSISQLFFVTEPSGVANLKQEGHNSKNIHLVGNVMIDTLLKMKKKSENLHAYKRFSLKPHQYAYLTLHRPANVDDFCTLEKICELIIWTAQRMPIIFSVHPRTKKCLKMSELYSKLANESNVFMAKPLGYLESLSLLINAKVVITDSGGMQEETTALKIPCLTLRENTERPITIEKGTNTLIKRDWKLFQKCIKRIENNSYLMKCSKIPYWDGKTGKRILGICKSNF